jgi:hypothetical protein
LSFAFDPFEFAAKTHRTLQLIQKLILDFHQNIRKQFLLTSTGFSFHSPLPEPTLLIVNHLSDLRYSFPVPDLLTDTGILATALPPIAQNRTYRNYLLSADPLLSSIGAEEPDDNALLNELRQSRPLPDDSRSSVSRMQRTQVRF